MAFAEQVQQEIYELGQARIAAVQALEQAVAVIGKARMGVHADNSHQISSIELAEIEQQTAKLTALAGGSLATGLTVGAVSAIGAYGIVGAVGVASTGTAIATLSGAAATNATLAALGGGALAAGGLGMAGGAAVLSGIFALPVLAGLAIGAEAIGSKAEKKANAIETAKIGEIKRHPTHELQATTIKLTESLMHAIRDAKGNWFQRIVAFMKRRRKREIDERIYQVALIAKHLSAIVDETVVPPRNDDYIAANLVENVVEDAVQTIADYMECNATKLDGRKSQRTIIIVHAFRA